MDQYADHPPNTGGKSGEPPEITAARRWMYSFGWHPEHMEQVAGLAVNIFDQLGVLHRLGKRWRTILEAAATVHDIGWTVSPQSHHKHAARLVRERRLPGFDEREQSLIALVVRYHRKASPRAAHSRFNRLEASDQDGVRKLAAMIRIADGLDRTHRSLVKSLRCDVGKDRVVFLLRMSLPSPDDIAAARTKANLFEDVFGRCVVLSPTYPDVSEPPKQSGGMPGKGEAIDPDHG